MYCMCIKVFDKIRVSCRGLSGGGPERDLDMQLVNVGCTEFFLGINKPFRSV